MMMKFLFGITIPFFLTLSLCHASAEIDKLQKKAVAATSNQRL